MSASFTMSLPSSNAMESLSPLRLAGIGRRKRLPESERLYRGAVAAKKIKPGDGFGDGWPMTRRHPPQDEERLAHLLEPFPAAAQNLHVSRPVDVLVERLDIPPHRHVDEHIGVVEWTNGGGVAFFGLEPPYESGEALGQSIDAVQIRGEIRHDRRDPRA